MALPLHVGPIPGNSTSSVTVTRAAAVLWQQASSHQRSSRKQLRLTGMHQEQWSCHLRDRRVYP
jgi:hypothetical protein